MTNYVKVEIPSRYGTVYVVGKDGKERAHTAGDVVEVPEKQARSIGAVLPEKPKAKISLNQDKE